MQSKPMHKLSINFQKVAIPGTVLTSKYSDQNDQQETEYLINTFIKDNYLSDIKNANHIRKKTVSEAIKALRSLIDIWHQKIISKLKENSETSKNSKALLAQYGSYRYDALMLDGDLDCLVLGPSEFEREKHFFGELPSVLETDPNISEIQTIKTAYVPVLKLKYSNLSIDLVFAAIDTSNLSYDNFGALEDDSILDSLDKETQRSLNGFRNAEKLLSIVPDLENFKTTLKLVKIWAKAKGIYSNAMGYLGGVSWAIMVAKIIQLFPNFEPSVLLWHFFRFYSEWKWPEFPIQLVEDLNLNLSAESVPMTIITPSYPGMNSSYNVSYSTFKIIHSHFQEAWSIIYQALEEKSSIPWLAIFEKYDFFKHYYQYIELSIGSDTRESYIKWRTFVESKLRYLTKSFEFYNYEKEIDLRPYPLPFERDGEFFNYCVSYYFGFKATRGLEEMENIKNFSPIARDLLESILAHKGKEDKLRFVQIKREQLPDVVFDGKRPEWAVKDWIEKRKEAMTKLKQSKEGQQQQQQTNSYPYPMMNQGNFGYYPYYNNYSTPLQGNGMHHYQGGNGNYPYQNNMGGMYGPNSGNFNKTSEDQSDNRENDEEYAQKKTNGI